MRKWEPIDLMKLYTLANSQAWNMMLTQCYHNLDFNRLAKVRYQICAGMTDLAKQGLNTNEINIWFARLHRSIDITARRMSKKKWPMPGDNPLGKSSPSALEAKRKRDAELAKFMHESSM